VRGRRLRAGGDRQVPRLDRSVAQPERQRDPRALDRERGGAVGQRLAPGRVRDLRREDARGERDARAGARQPGKPLVERRARAGRLGDAAGRHDHRAAALGRTGRRGRRRHRREPQLAVLHRHGHPPADQRPSCSAVTGRPGQLRHQLRRRHRDRRHGGVEVEHRVGIRGHERQRLDSRAAPSAAPACRRRASSRNAATPATTTSAAARHDCDPPRHYVEGIRVR
jgi:hypothetical protein